MHVISCNVNVIIILWKYSDFHAPQQEEELVSQYFFPLNIYLKSPACLYAHAGFRAVYI